MTVKRLNELFQDGVPFAIGEHDLEAIEGEAPHSDRGNGQDKKDVPEFDAGCQDLPLLCGLTWDAIGLRNNPAVLFRYGGEPCRIEYDDEGAPFPRPLTEDRLLHEVARAVRWYKTVKVKDGHERRPAFPTRTLIRDMKATPGIPLPVLLGIIESPIIAQDESFHNTPGYSLTTGLFYAPAKGFHVPPVPLFPSTEDIARAREIIICELLGDFPFTGEAELAHAVALLVLPFARNLIEGPTPLTLIEKPTPGTGASLLATVLTFPFTGRIQAATTEGRDEDEWRKRITAKLRHGAGVFYIDNLRRRLESATVSAFLTATVWEDRILGTSDNIRLPVRCVCVATGNNPSLSDEITRRTVRVRLDARQDRPWQRTGFRHPNLFEWASANRADIVWAALTFIRAWLAEGKTGSQSAPVLGMFEEWSRIMGGILDVAGIPGFLGNLAAFYDTSDTEGADARAFLSAWREEHYDSPVGVADLWAIASAPNCTLNLGDKGERSQKIRLGKMLSQLRDRHYRLDDGATVCVKAAGQNKGVAKWRLKGSG